MKPLAKWSRVAALLLLWFIPPVEAATSAEAGLFQPTNWKTSKSKSGVNYLRCVSAKCGRTTIVSYSYIRSQVGLASFIAAGEEIRRTFLKKGLATRVELGAAASSTQAGFKLYSQTSRISKEGGAAETFVRGWLVGRKASLDILVTSAEDVDARKAFDEFVQLSGAMLALWETMPKGTCLQNDLMTSCFGPD